MLTDPSSIEVQRLVASAVKSLRDKEYAQAEEEFRSILSTYPNHIDAMRFLGLVLGLQGRFKEAETQLQQTIERAPNFTAAHLNLGSIYHEQGDLLSAERSLKMALALDSSLPNAWKQLSLVLSAQGKSQESEKALERADIEAQSGNLLERARACVSEGKIQQAEALYKKLLEINSAHSVAHSELARIVYQRRGYNEAEFLLKRSIAHDAKSFRDWALYGDVLRSLFKFEESRDALETGLKKFPNDFSLWLSLGQTFDKLLKHEEALFSYQKVLQLKPDQPDTLILLGNLYNGLGKTKEAVSYYQKALTAPDKAGEAYWSLSNLKTYKFGPDEVTDMTRLLENPNRSFDDSVFLNFALGKVAEDACEYNSAFTYYSEANKLYKNRLRKDEVDLAEKETDQIIDLFTRDFFQEREGYGCEDVAPIFIVGLPRSGSTLLEQMLSSHSCVDATSELPNIMQLVNHLRVRGQSNAGKTYPEIAAELTKDECDNLGKAYIENTQKYRGEALHFIDKTPSNFFDIGLIHLILPRAKIIDMRRHPLAVCFACFKQHFGSERAFTYDMEDLGRYFLNYIRLMNHWGQVLPGVVHKVEYEGLVSEPEESMCQVLDFCELSFEEACLRFYESERNVRTPSAAQVRKPIYSNSVKLWEHYEKHLGELRTLLAPVLGEE